MEKRFYLTQLRIPGLNTGWGQSDSSVTIVTDRPNQTEASSTAGKGVLQIESGLSFMKEGVPIFRNGQNESYAWNTLWRVGIFKRVELCLVTQPEIQRQTINGMEVMKVGGISDVQLGFKVNLLEPKEGRTEIGFLSHLVVPSGTAGLSGQEVGVINKLAVTHSLSETHTLAYNIGYDYLGLGNGDLFYSLSWGVTISNRVAIYVEPYGLIADMDEFRLNADAGFTYLISDNIQFDYSFGVGITEEMNYHAIGLSVRLAK